MFPTHLGPSRVAPPLVQTKETASTSSNSTTTTTTTTTGNATVVAPPTIIVKHVDPMLEHFFCCLVPDAGYACRAVRMGLWDFSDSGSNPSESLDEDILAVAAYRAKLVPSGVSRHAVRRVLTDHIQALQRQQQQQQQQDGKAVQSKAVAPFPLRCWSKEKLKRLEELSLDMELNLFGGGDGSSASSRRRRDIASVHHELFTQAVAKQKFCSVAATRTLQAWEDFFNSKDYIQRLLNYTVREVTGEDLTIVS